MASISDFLGSLIALLLRLIFALAAVVLAVSLLLAGLVAVAFMLLRALLTGQRPAPVVLWQRYRAASQASAARWTRRPGSSTPGNRPPQPGMRPLPADVVDVPSRDIPPR
jgi:hypothetical protein